jgi:hypothetical protein
MSERKRDSERKRNYIKLTNRGARSSIVGPHGPIILILSASKILSPEKPTPCISLPQMEDYNRARQYGDGTMQMESYYGPPPPRPAISYDLRSYSSSYPQTQVGSNRDLKLKKRKSASGLSSKSWAFGDPEFQRKKRVASYKMYSVEGKMKGSLRRSFRWLKDKYTQVLYGWW